MKTPLSVVFFIVCMFNAPSVFSQTAQEEFLAQQWVLDANNSVLQFQSIKDKNGPKPEYSEFAFIDGAVDQDGVVTFNVQMDSIDTKIDLRNVRMRFLFFETFSHPTATASLKLENQLISELLSEKRIRRTLPFNLNLHGVSKQLEVDVILTMIGGNKVAVTTVSPLVLSVEAFGLLPGLAKLEEAAQVTILPSAAVQFDFVFNSTTLASSDSVTVATATQPKQSPIVKSAALETVGAFSRSECVGRFEILSQTGAIYFESGSASLSTDSVPLLSTLTDIVQRCPDISVVVEGHTDAYGADHINMALSEARAGSVVNYLVARGISERRVRGVGFGETRPVVGNDTARNRSRNRRIEFKVADG